MGAGEGKRRHPPWLTLPYLQQNVNELNQWLSAIRKASICNELMLPSCHRGAFRGNRWTCCLQPDRTGNGPRQL